MTGVNLSLPTPCIRVVEVTNPTPLVDYKIEILYSLVVSTVVLVAFVVMICLWCFRRRNRIWQAYIAIKGDEEVAAVNPPVPVVSSPTNSSSVPDISGVHRLDGRLRIHLPGGETESSVRSSLPPTRCIIMRGQNRLIEADRSKDVK